MGVLPVTAGSFLVNTLNHAISKTEYAELDITFFKFKTSTNNVKNHVKNNLKNNV